MALARASGAISTDTQVRTGMGNMTYMEAGQVVLTAYDGTSSTGLLLASVESTNRTNFNTPVEFSDGLFVSVASTTGTGVVHTG